MQPKTTSETPATTTNDPATSPEPSTRAEPSASKDAPRKGAGAKPKAAKKAPARMDAKPKPTTYGPLTLEQLAKLYVKHLEKAGKSPTTQISYAQDLLLAIEHFGANEPVEHITGARILIFNGSDLVMKTKTGRGKAKPTVLKTRRVLRQALTWAAEQGLIAKAPEFDRDAEKAV